jgi:hypothetical protein
MDRNIRIPVDFSKDDKVIQFNLEQEFDNLEILSLKITNSEAYTRQCSNFGVVVGRVMLNSGFGVQNAKVNIFIPLKDEDKERPEILELYPFETVNDTYPNGVRYNLFPRVKNGRNPSHKAIGNFPHETDFTHYPQYLEIMDKYYKYTTTTNESGDFMIFGVPTGQHDIIMDFDLFDTKSFELTANDLVEQISLNNSIEEIRSLLLSNSIDAEEQTINRNKVPNFVYLGNNNFDVEVKTNIDEMPNIFHQVKQITVSPFWGDDDQCDVGITRCDFKINFKYTPTAIFFGYIHSPSGGFTINPDYNYNITTRRPEIHANDKSKGYVTGDIYPYQKMEVVVYRLDDKLNPGSRKRLGVFTGSYYNGVFRLSLPMYMDYYITNEFGDLVPTNDTTNGIPTKGYYAFEIYDTDDRWTGRRLPWGGFANQILPGVRIPTNGNGDVWLGGWGGTWGGLFEYDILKRRRKFYTVKTIHKKHSLSNALLPGNFVGYFPQYNPNKSDATWNFPLHYNQVTNIDEPTIIGSILIPRFYINYEDNTLKRPHKFLTEPWKDKSDTYNEWVGDWEMYLGLGVKKEGGKNSGSVYSDLFNVDDFIGDDGNNIFGDNDTWNFGDNTNVVFNASLYATELSKKKGSNANGSAVHKAYNQVADDGRTYGVFINSVEYNGKEPILEVYIDEITDELPDLIKDQVYSSFRKGQTSSIRAQIIESSATAKNTAVAKSITESSDIFVEGPEQFITTTNEETATSNNSYKGKYYYFGLWKGANALYDIETNYFVK